MTERVYLYAVATLAIAACSPTDRSNPPPTLQEAETSVRDPFDCEPTARMLDRIGDANLGEVGREVLAEARAGDEASLSLLGDYAETGYQGAPVDPHLSGCLEIAAYRSGYTFSAMDVAELHLAAGDTLEAVRNYGVAFGHGRVNEMLVRSATGIDPIEDIGPRPHHYAFTRVLNLAEAADSSMRASVERVFQEGVTSGVGQTGELQRLYGR